MGGPPSKDLSHIKKGDQIISKPQRPHGPHEDGTRVNTRIQAPKVRLIDNTGEMIGVVSQKEALTMAEELGLDLVEISPNADPPVCKLLDYGKYKYELQKKNSEAKKKQHVVVLKEVTLRPGIEEHDYQVKLKNMKKFLSEGDKVKITMRFRGRQLAHQDLGVKVLERIKQDLGDFIKVDQEPRLEGRQALMLISPK